MMVFTKKHLFSILLSVTVFLLGLELILSILWGYTSGSIIVFLLMDVVPRVRYLLIMLSIVATIWSIVKHQHKMFFTFSWIFLALFGVAVSKIPLGHFETLGGLLSLHNADPNQVVIDARMLAEKHPLMTCFGFPERYPCDNPIPYDKIPDSIQNIYASQNILILDDYVLIEKFGLLGVFRGFVVFREGADLWKNEKTIARQKGCNDCWKIRIVDGLYWYIDSDPQERPIFISPLK